MTTPVTPDYEGPGKTQLPRLLAAYQAMREKRSLIKREYDEQDGELKRRMGLIDVALMKMMTEIGSEQLKITGIGMAYLTRKTYVRAKDWEAIWKYIEESGSLDLLQRRLSETAVKTFMDSNDGRLPPGVDVTVEREVVVKKA